ncbi:MAG: hypothetical protein AAF481_06470 [Acidobacteriota bacterium]
MNFKSIVAALVAVGLFGVVGCISARTKDSAADMRGVSDQAATAAVADGELQPPRQEKAAPPPADPPKLTCEVSCSDLVLRTGKARIAWSLADRSPEALRSVADAPRRLETTVFKHGFDRGNYLTLSLGDASDESAQSRKMTGADRGLRAYELQITDSTSAQSLRSKVSENARSAEIFAVVEGLEPGLNYTWRVVVGSPSGEWLSPSVTCTAPVCPADLVGEEGPQ